MKPRGARILASAAVLMAAQSQTARADIGTVALAPITGLAGDSDAAAVRAAQAAIGHGIEGVTGATLIPPDQVAKRARAAHQARLLSCTEQEQCLRKLGRLAGADVIIQGELGGLGSAQVIYLKLIRTDGGPAQSTTLSLSANSDDKAVAAVTRLLAPERYTGTLALAIDAEGAAVFVDGQRLGISPLTAPLSLEVGSHALRVTHPEYRDYVRFVNIEFHRQRSLDIGLQQFPIVASSSVDGGGADSITLQGKAPTRERPWYRRWYTIAGAGAAVLITSAIIVGLASDGIDADRERTVMMPR
ncbi:MAG TPA: PEGA domain-containing protein [Kofleriaceae bacterium]|nr:PEGA domain-containing protein [Kofleriaceae bacterium]